MQMNNGLMRYHSAPTSMLAELLDDDLVQRDSDAFSQVEASEFARFLDDHLYMTNPFVDSQPLPPAGCNSMPLFTTEEGNSTINETRPQIQTGKKILTAQQSQYIATGRSRPNTDAIGGPLSSISEHDANESSVFTSPIQLSAHMKMGEWKTSHVNAPIPNAGGLPYMKSHLARHNSSPADVLSRLVMDEGTGKTVLHFGSSFTHASKEGSIIQHVNMASLLPANSTKANQVEQTIKPKDGTGVVEDARRVKSRMEESKSCLLRQNSSPASLLSQKSFGAMSSSSNTKLSSSSLSGNYSEEDNRGGAYQAATFWDDIVSDKTGSVYGKRERESQSMHTSQSSEVTVTNQDIRGHGKMCPGTRINTEVLCRVSAKRGCATHPRSITERVRRNKINEGMRKLQELMPNMEKQTNTVTMLDEAVEYLKLLQRQVQELSESQPKCDGMCHLKGNS